MQPSFAERPPRWLWPTILSLDAPAVALLWQWLLARSASVAAPRAPEVIVLGCSVWLAYAGDRWIEGWRLAPGAVRTHRHRFHQRWRWPVAFAWTLVLAVDLAAAFLGLSRAALAAGAVLLVAVAVYLFSHQLIHRASRWRAPKEACVALLLAAGAAVFPACRAGPQIGRMAIPLALFSLLCFSNCALISVWENEVDRSHGETSLALQFGRAAEFAPLLPWAVSLLAAAAWIWAGEKTAPCAAASGVLLGLVDRAEGRIGRVLARVLADAALMTPLIPLVAGFRS